MDKSLRHDEMLTESGRNTEKHLTFKENLVLLMERRNKLKAF